MTVTNSGSTTGAAAAADSQTDGLTPGQRKQKAAAEVRKAVADADKAEVDARTAAVPASDVEPIEGKVDVGENAGLVGQVVAYRMLNLGAEEIAKVVSGHLGENGRLLIVEDRDLAAGNWAYRMIRAQLDKETEALDKVLAAFQASAAGERGRREFVIEAAAALGAVSSLIGGAAGIAGMFKSNYSLSSRAVTIGPTPLVAALVSHFPEGRATIHGFTLRGSTIVDDFWVARDKRLSVAEKATDLRAQTLDPADQQIEDHRAALKNVRAELDKAIATDTANDALKQRVHDAEVAVEAAVSAVADERALLELADAAVQRFDGFATVATTGKRPPLLAASMHERLNTGDAKYTHVLFAAAEGASAETITRQRRFGNPDAGFLGGVALSYLLLKVEDDSIVAAGTKPLLGHVKYHLKDARLESLKQLQ